MSSVKIIPQRQTSKTYVPRHDNSPLRTNARLNTILTIRGRDTHQHWLCARPLVYQRIVQDDPVQLEEARQWWWFEP